MSKQPRLDPDELERRVRQLQEAMSQMSIDELCELIRNIEAMRRKSADIDTVFPRFGPAVR
jgi:hypothetical protein